MEQPAWWKTEKANEIADDLVLAILKIKKSHIDGCDTEECSHGKCGCEVSQIHTDRQCECWK